MIWASVPEAAMTPEARRNLRKQDARGEDEERVEAGENEPGDERALVHVADGAAELVGHDDQHE